MKAFDEAIKRIDEIDMPEEFRPTVISVFKKMSKAFDAMPGLKIDLETLFEQKLFHSLKIEKCTEEELLKHTQDASAFGVFDDDENIIYSVTDDEEVLCHEFVHFLVHKLHPEKFEKGNQIPTWIDESLTQTVTNAVLEYGGNARAYHWLVSLSNFIQRNIGQKLPVVDFLNGNILDVIKSNEELRFVFERFGEKLDYYTHHPVDDDGDAYRNEIVEYCYERHIKKLLADPNIKFEEVLQNIAKFETQDIRTGETNPFTIEVVERHLIQKDRTWELKTLIPRFLYSKGIKVELTEEQEQKAETFILNYIAYLRKRYYIEAGGYSDGRNSFSPEELKAVSDLPEIKKMLNEACNVATEKKNKHAQGDAIENFLKDDHQKWASINKDEAEENIKILNKLSETFNVPLLMAEKNESPKAGNAYFLCPDYSEVSKEKIAQEFKVSCIDELKSVAKTFKHGDQSNIIIEIKGERVPVGNIVVAGEDVAVAINWKAVWKHLPHEVKSEIESKILEKAGTTESYRIV